MHDLCNFGLNWKIPKKCCALEHDKISKQQSRPISWERYKLIANAMETFPIRGRICRKCEKAILDSIDDKSSSSAVNDDDDDYVPTMDELGPIDDFFNDYKNECRENLDKLTSSLDLPKVEHQIRNNINMLSEKTLLNLTQKIQNIRNQQFSLNCFRK